MTGLELNSRLVASARSIPAILITAYYDERVRAQALLRRPVLPVQLRPGPS